MTASGTLGKMGRDSSCEGELMSRGDWGVELRFRLLGFVDARVELGKGSCSCRCIRPGACDI